MINRALLQPESIVVVGASNQLSKPGGRLLSNLIQHHTESRLYVVNPHEHAVQGIEAQTSIADLPTVDLAFLAIPAEACVRAVEQLAAEKQCRAFVVLSAGFSETDEAGKQLEHELCAVAARYEASLIGPNCIGLITPQYAGVFTRPVPRLSAHGIDFISGSGATAVFTMEAGMPKGLHFSSVWSVGNSAQIGVEEVLEQMDESFVAGQSSTVKLLYMESIRNPQKLLKHARSLVMKGCRIAAVKAGTSAGGARAAQSHTGALASPDEMVDALFRKVGIIRCYGREELIAVAGVLLYPELKTQSLAIVTHAGGPAVMLTDLLEKGGFSVPPFPESEVKRNLKAQLFPGSSVENPIDFLATGTAEQLGECLSACEGGFDEAGGIVVIFGSPGLSPVDEVYRLLAEKIRTSVKPIYPVLPSVINAGDAIREFTESGLPCFFDEAELGKALVRVAACPVPQPLRQNDIPMNPELVRLFCRAFKSGFLPTAQAHSLLDVAGIARAKEEVALTEADALRVARGIGFPVALKVVGPLHKSDVGGVLLNISDEGQLRRAYHRLMKIEGACAVSISEMLHGTELYIGAKYEAGYGHLLVFGLGGIWLEALKDVRSVLVPVDENEIIQQLEQLQGMPVLQGKRGQCAVSIPAFVNLIWRVSALIELVPEIRELDFNPVFAQGDSLRVADVRIRFESTSGE